MSEDMTSGDVEVLSTLVLKRPGGADFLFGFGV
jgi:hypothetical protein